ncbi:hypothetical protein BU14_0520s0004 [Porphyra umbilicalis]|uniref:Uncharacterized protein n=1 Tax=Porphyra umbilicalis TaxID=2786 RepID=A0A1X6NSJ7_PORUM|nr:hypothetical protein BU14_0520s0004 [Porphyra umbilicalis]|eukprot:OSX71584.1 hypothetical protein BU14_0520s0004 [Porphyra umbilicalis]
MVRSPARAALVALTLAAFVTEAAAAPPPTPTPKAMKVFKGGAFCAFEWFGSGSFRWLWKDVTESCTPAPAPVIKTSKAGSKKCTETVASCGTYRTPTKKCGWNMCTTTDCVTAPSGLPVSASRAPAAGCPPRPLPMHTRFVKANGERCVKDWSACGAVRTASGACVWKDCDVFKCKAPCVATKPMGKSIVAPVTIGTRPETIDLPRKVCSSGRWPVSATVNMSNDLMSCTWAWKDWEVCYCKTGAPLWTKC